MIRNRFIVLHNWMYAIVLLAILSSCTALDRPKAIPGPGSLSAEDARIVRLEADLSLLLGYQDRETLRLAQTIVATTDELAMTYRVQPPALWHNFLVNLGVRERGLCCHWTQDLLKEINALQLAKYHAAWGVSRYGTWREHNSVVITAAGKAFETGIVMDPWRHAGELYWIHVATDTYRWQPHPGDNDTDRIRCR
jgi:hypothetical protein